MNESFREERELRINLHNAKYNLSEKTKEIEKLKEKIAELNEEVVYWTKAYREEVRKQGWVK